MKFDIYYKTISANDVESETKTYRCESDYEMKEKMKDLRRSEGLGLIKFVDLKIVR